GRPDGMRRDDVRLALSPERVVGAFETRPVGRRRGHALLQRPLLPSGADDELAATDVGHAVFRAEGIEPVATLDAEPGFERARRVVQPRVNDTAVVGRRDLTGARVLLEDADLPAAQGE